VNAWKACQPERSRNGVEKVEVLKGEIENIAAVEHADVVQSEESALEQVSAPVVLLVHLKGESETLLNDPLQKIQIARVARIGLAPLLAVDLEHPPGRPGLNGWIRIIEFPFVCRELSIGVHIPPERVDELNYHWNPVRWVNVVHPRHGGEVSFFLSGRIFRTWSDLRDSMSLVHPFSEFS
jgi:hypothetical protein